MKTPKWFTDWLENDYAHLVKKVDKIDTNVSWIKWLVGFTLFALIAAAVANLFM